MIAKEIAIIEDLRHQVSQSDMDAENRLIIYSHDQTESEQDIFGLTR